MCVVRWSACDYYSAMSPARLVFRATCTLLILLGLAGSVIEGAACKDSEQRSGRQVGALTGLSLTISDHAPSPSQGTNHCCPCIHTFPVGVSATESLVAVLLSGDAGFSFASQLIRTRRPEPLVPPPVA